MSNKRNKVFVLLVATAFLASCADYMNRRDSVSLRAGDAVEGNNAIHEVSPWPRHAENTTIN